MFPTLLLSAMLYGRGRKVLTLWGGRERSSSDSGVRAGKPGDTSLSSWPVLVLLALDKKRELQGRLQTERKEYARKKDKGNGMRVERCWFCVDSSTMLLVLDSEVNVMCGKTERSYSAVYELLCTFRVSSMKYVLIY